MQNILFDIEIPLAGFYHRWNMMELHLMLRVRQFGDELFRSKASLSMIFIN